jgi:DNA-binding transcriptional MocR family regulator
MQKNDYLYLKIADNFENQIVNDILKLGEKLPSVRTICREYGVSMSTALQAYFILENKCLIESRPQSGYYVSYTTEKYPQVPKISSPADEFGDELADKLIAKVFKELASHDETVLFSLGVPSVELLPVAKLNKSMNRALIELPSGGTKYDHIQGNPRLRRQIAKLAYSWDGKFTEKDIITTGGCINAITYCLTSITKPGDTIAVESPCYFGILQLAKSFGLNVLEIPTDSKTGIEIDALKKALEQNKIAVCLLVSNFSNPLGSCIPDENKKYIVNLLETYGIPLIEDDLYGDIYFGKSRPKTCKTYDESGNVMLCSSISKTLAPGYRVGWVIPGKFKNKIIKTKLLQSISSPTLTQEAIADFLEHGRYEHHLRNMRNTLYLNSMQFLSSIGNYFPEGTKVTRPQGGFFLWLELDPKYNTSELFEKALKHKISIAPGRMFSLQNLYTNCMRLNYGWLWNPKIDNAIRTLGNLLKE